MDRSLLSAASRYTPGAPGDAGGCRVLRIIVFAVAIRAPDGTVERAPHLEGCAVSRAQAVCRPAYSQGPHPCCSSYWRSPRRRVEGTWGRGCFPWSPKGRRSLTRQALPAAVARCTRYASGPVQLLRRALLVPPELLFERSHCGAASQSRHSLLHPHQIHALARAQLPAFAALRHYCITAPLHLQPSGLCRLRLQAQVPVCSVRGVSSGILKARAGATTSSLDRRHAAVFPSSTGRSLLAVHGLHCARGQHGPLAHRRRCPPRHARGRHVPSLWQ